MNQRDSQQDEQVDRRSLLRFPAAASLTAAGTLVAETPTAVVAQEQPDHGIGWFADRESATAGRTPKRAVSLIVARHDPGAPVTNAVFRKTSGRSPLQPWEIATDGGSRRWTLSPEQSVSPQMFGARGDGKTDDTVAFNGAAAFIQHSGGGRLVVPPGEYHWGVQEFAGRRGRGFAYQGQNLIEIHGCERPVVIEFQGCRIVSRSGLRYGSFNPQSGTKHPSKSPFYEADFTASIGSVVDVENNSSVVISGSAEFDGNLSAMVVGGVWGDSGTQLRHAGVVAYNNRAFRCENIHAHHFGLDGFMIGWRGLTEKHPIFPHILRNCQGKYNGRQGLSWVGGNSLRVEGGDFSCTGKSGFLFSPPGAGIDIEAEESICRNGHFVGVRCADNAGVGLLADQGNSASITAIDCTFIGTTMWSVWVLKPEFTFVRCRVIGAVAWLMGNGSPAKAAKVIGGRWSMNPQDSPSGVIYGEKMDFGAARNVLFDGVDFTAAGPSALPWSGGESHYSNCTFAQEGDADFYTRGVFTGRCTFDAPKGRFDYNGSQFIGQVLLNGKTLTI